MKIKNYMESVVNAEVTQQRQSGRQNTGCWCPLCEADIVSLSLTLLPPRYCMEQSYGLVSKKTYPGSIRSAVQRAEARVHLHPKHRPGVPDYYPHRIRIVNLAFEEGSALVKSVMMNALVPCICYQCMADTLAFALNRFPPYYGVELDGSLKYTPLQREFIRHDLSLVLEHSAKAISSHPHH